MILNEKLTELRNLMKYYELVARNMGDVHSKWILRNTTDEGLGQGVNKVAFEDDDLEILIDRALDYAKNGPDKEVLKAAEEVTILFKRRTLIQGDVISVIIQSMTDEKIEQQIVDMGWKYGRFNLESFYLYDIDDEQSFISER